MIRRIIEKFRFSEIRKDKWLASVGHLPEQDIIWLKQRELAFFAYRAFKFTVLFPVSFVRRLVSLAQILNEFERLHFSPLRKIHRGMDCVIDKQTWFVNGHNIQLGDFVKISSFSSVIAGNVSTIKIGTNTIIGPGVTIVSLNHGMALKGEPLRYQEWEEISVFIGDNVWIGANVVILPGTTIGTGSIIGAGAVIKGAIPPETITYSKNGQLKTVQRE